ncbi:MAG: type VI secretion system tip protein VgrG [Planctomycetes bacterium]|nr:type VI secretion system tip protein VgrG [Planctomycetota bacterium]MCB9936375.1 type VI secretion system tip protein VgrG [Planctomycetota bacterium]
MSKQRPFMFKVSWLDSDAGKNADELYVTAFAGTEEIARPYHIELNLISRSAPSDFRNILKRRCCLSIQREVTLAKDDAVGHTTRLIHGMLKSFELRGYDGTSYLYRTVLVPRLWRATQNVVSRVFVDQALWSILSASWSDQADVDVLTDNQRISNQNPTRAFTMQYRESSLNFLSRWIEFYGISYYFQQEEDAEKAVFTNVKEGFLPLSTGRENRVAYEAGAQASRQEAIHSVLWRHSLVPNTLTMADYNISDPTSPIREVIDIGTPGTGDHVQIDSDTTSFDVANVLEVRKDEYLGSNYRIFGESNVRALSAGYTFKINSNPVEDAGTEYLLVRVTHQGEQTVDVNSGQASGARYKNEYEAIPNSITFRPAHVTPRPQVGGFVHGVVENEDGATYPGIDDDGYYRVRLFFDNDSSVNNSSAPIRKMEPYGGPDRGMHMPLINGTEVVVGFLGGDPDQPFIVGALPGPSQKSPVVSSNRDQTIISTKATKIVMQDLEGEESIILSNKGTFAGQNLSVLTDASFSVGNSTKSFSTVASMAAMQTDIALVSKVIQGIVAVSIASMVGVSMMAGYKKIQAAIAALMVGLTIGYTYETDAKRSGKQPAALANIIMPILNLVLTLAIVGVQMKLLQRALAKGLKMKMTPRNIVWPERERRIMLSANTLGTAASRIATFFSTLFTMKSFTEAYTKSKAIQGVDEADIHGMTMVRAGDGNSMAVYGQGKSILIATDSGSIDMIAEKDFTVHGSHVLSTAETGMTMLVMGKPTQPVGSCISLTMNTATMLGPGEMADATVRVGSTWVALGNKVLGTYSPTKNGTGIVINDGETLISSKAFGVATNNGKVGIAAGEEFGVYLMGKMDKGIVLDSNVGKITLNGSGITIEEKTGKGVKIQSTGAISIATAGKLTLSGSSVKIGGASVAIDGPNVKINGTGVGALGGAAPTPPVVKPVIPPLPLPPVVPSPPVITKEGESAVDKAGMARVTAILKWLKSNAGLGAKS